MKCVNSLTHRNNCQHNKERYCLTYCFKNVKINILFSTRFRWQKVFDRLKSNIIVNCFTTLIVYVNFNQFYKVN